MSRKNKRTGLKRVKSTDKILMPDLRTRVLHPFVRSVEITQLFLMPETEMTGSEPSRRTLPITESLASAQ